MCKFSIGITRALLVRYDHWTESYKFDLRPDPVSSTNTKVRFLKI